MMKMKQHTKIGLVLKLMKLVHDFYYTRRPVSTSMASRYVQKLCKHKDPPMQDYMDKQMTVLMVA